MKIDFAKGMAPDDVAAAIVAALRRNTTEKIIGSDARCDVVREQVFPQAHGLAAGTQGEEALRDAVNGGVATGDKDVLFVGHVVA